MLTIVNETIVVFGKTIIFEKKNITCNFIALQVGFLSSLTIVNDDPSLTIVNITVNKNISKTIVFKNERYAFSKSSKRVGRF